MRIATWNVNSIRAREARLDAWLAAKQPDVLCLQELKVTEDAFPYELIRKHGYEAIVSGQKTYNGVAILSRAPLEEATRGLGDDVDDPQARLVSARTCGVRVVCVYVPNGGMPDSDKFTYKLAWLTRLEAAVRTWVARGEELVVCGDLNVAPDDLDVKNPEVWRNTVLCHQQVRDAFDRLVKVGLVDVFRKHHPQGQVFSWWDYRMLGFPKNDGLRIDHILATPKTAARSTSAHVDREERKGKGASDHAPVVLELSDA